MGDTPYSPWQRGDSIARQRSLIAENGGDTRIPVGPRTSCAQRGQSVKFAADTAEAIKVYDRAAISYEKALAGKFEAYRQLVIGSRYVDDVLEVWPNAHGVVAELTSTGHALTISREAMKLIAEDNAGSA